MTELSEILKNVSDVKQEVQDYITNTEHYIFYWADEKEVKSFIKEHLEDYENLIQLTVESIFGESSAYVRIQLGLDNDEDDDEEKVIVINGYCHLEGFKEYVEHEWGRFNGKIKELRIKEVEKQLEFFRNRVNEYETLLNGLRNGSKQK